MMAAHCENGSIVMATLPARPQSVDIDLKRTAIVVVDMQNSFVSKGGMFDLAGFDISGAAPVITVNRRLLDAGRKAGVKVVYLYMAFKPDLSDAGDPTSPAYHKELALRMMRERPNLSGKLLVDHTWDAAIIDALKPQPGDRVIRKTRYDGFCRTELDGYLREQNIRYLLFTGVATNVCVESTARHAFFNEFWPILIEDAMNNSGPDFNRQATLWNFEHTLGWVTDSQQVLAVLQTHAREAQPA
jgi:ureidoacrylate peracid hydrolase